MKLFVVGSGGREHALVWKLSQSPAVTRLYAAPGNPGMAPYATLVPIKADVIPELLAFAEAERIDLTVVGPEQPLALGIVDAFQSRGLKIFGPAKAAADLECSKIFAKELMAKHGIPTARFRTADDATAARRYAREFGAPLVVKADGLAGGKGAIVCRTLEEADRAIGLCLEEKAFGAAGGRVVVEEFLEGEEASFFAVTDGESILPFGVAQDHKAVFDDDQGPNTGGMGAYSSPTMMTDELAREVIERIVTPTVRAMAAEGRPYRGVVYAGLMLTKEGPKVVEFNCRFGDPEAQAILIRLNDDLLPILMAVASGEPLPREVAWTPQSAVCVVLASGGYPGSYATGKVITGVEMAEAPPSLVVFHAGTALKDRRLVTAGGRVLGVTARAISLRAALSLAYEAVASIHFDGMHYRRDIGRRALTRLGR
jgi:phosphoribosylamine--glycine ligase